MANTSDFAVEKPTPGGYRNTWGGTVNTALDKLTELLALALPVGTIQIYPKATAPAVTGSGGTWLICDGSAISRTTYSVLFGIIVETYGNGDGSNTFNIPDLRARVPVGFNTSTIGSGVTVRSDRAIAATSGGTEGHILIDAEIPKHTHPITDAGHIHATTETAHTHTGETAKAKADIVLNDHTHGYPRITDYLPDAGSTTGTVRTFLTTHRQDTDGTTNSFTGTALLSADGDSNLGHKHSIAGSNLASVATALTIDNNNTDITVNEQGTGDASHNIMQPFVVVQYIILAKHPTF